MTYSTPMLERLKLKDNSFNLKFLKARLNFGSYTRIENKDLRRSLKAFRLVTNHFQISGCLRFPRLKIDSSGA